VGVVARVVLAAAAVGGAVFAVQGGEYSTTDLRAQRVRRAVLQAEVDTLGRVVDSLRALEKRLGSDPALQERVAREEFGMVRGDKELLYRFADAPRAGTAGDSARPSPAPAAAP
jgi:cell division protein FtsB